MVGKYVYGEWLIPLVDYFSTVKRKEIVYEIVIPIIIALIGTIIYLKMGYALKALIKLRDILPTVLAILIGFSISSITILIASNNKNIEALKGMSTEGRIIAGKQINIYQWILLMFIYTLLIEIFLLIFIFFSSFFIQIVYFNILASFFLFMEVIFLIHILLVLIRNITHLYFVLYK